MAHKVKSNHYVATHRGSGVDSPSSGGGYVHRGYSTDGEESHRAASERTLSEYTMVNDRTRTPSATNGHTRRTRTPGPRSTPARAPMHATDSAEDVYVTSAAYKPPSEIRSRPSRMVPVSDTEGLYLQNCLHLQDTLHVSLPRILGDPALHAAAVPRHSRAPRSVYSYRSAVAPSLASTHKSKTSRKAGVKVDAMAAPNPFCPNVRGMCCLMLLLNLGLILVTLGFVIVIQFFEPLFVWILGIVFLIFGFLTLIGSLVYCVVLCRDSPYPRYPEDFYWTHHWSKTIGPSEIHYSTGDKPYRQNGQNDDRYSLSKSNGKFSDRESAKGYSDRESKLSRY